MVIELEDSSFSRKTWKHFTPGIVGDCPAKGGPVKSDSKRMSAPRWLARDDLIADLAQDRF